tara:strand:+ start:1840 stop:2331 length:492 start_codon:yes stop_codon:yes gene_type:complete
MAHFAEIKQSDNIVIRTVVVSNEDVNINGGEYSAQAEIWVQDNIPNDPILLVQFGGTYPNTYWKQCSYNNNKRKQYPGKNNHYYDSAKDKFICVKPYDSWTLNANDDWEAPTSMPNNNTLLNNDPLLSGPLWEESNLRWSARDENNNYYIWNNTDLTWDLTTE